MRSSNIDGFIDLCCYIKEKEPESAHAMNISSFIDIVNYYQDESLSPIRARLNGVVSEFFKQNEMYKENIDFSEKDILVIDKEACYLINIISAYIIPTVLNENKKNINDIENRIKSAKSEIEKYVEGEKEKFKDFYSTLANSFFEEVYFDTRKWYQKLGYKFLWLVFTAGFALSTLHLSWIFYHETMEVGTFDLFKFIYLFTMKFFILALLVWSIAWCAKMYQLARNQEIIMFNKRAIFKSYQLFMKSAIGEETKNAILTTAVKEFFTLPNTGFVPGKESNLDVLEQTTKIATALVSKAKPTGTS